MPYKLSEKVLSWLPPEQIDSNVMEQVLALGEMPFVYHHVAVMPDCHLGLGAAVGTCIPTRGAVIPAAVGVDIGCGMIAAQTSLTQEDLPTDLKPLRESIEQRIPLSHGRYNGSVRKTAKPRVQEMEELAGDRLAVYDKFDKRWRVQLGSLGGGNHFIEIVLDETNSVWAFLHSGSRGIGNRIAQHYIKTAQKLMDKYFIRLPDKDLSYLAEDTPEFDLYIRDLRWAQHFALLNREEMMERVLMALTYEVGEHEVQDKIQCHHNFTQKENHFGQNVWVTRKGAIRAREGDRGLIPGSMGAASYVVEGKGNTPAFDTAPHGAGRKFSRAEARRRFTMEDYDQQMVGIEARRDQAFIDEIPAAYKPIDLVMEQSAELVDVRRTFRQVVNVKGE